MKALFDDSGRCIALGDGAGFEEAVALPKKMTSTLVARYRLEDGRVVDRFAGLSDEEAVAKLEEERQAEERARLQALQAHLQERAHAPRQISKLAFMERFTDEELAAIYAAAKTDVRVEVWMDKLKLSEFVDLADPRTQDGVLNLEAAGLIGAGRGNEILAA